MTLKRLICCYIVILPVCFGDECHMANYRISFVCDTYNGAALSTHLGIRSVMDCTNMCTNDANCQSVIYDNATESCTTYSYFLSPPSLHCSHQVVYAALETHMVGSLNIIIPPITIMINLIATIYIKKNPFIVNQGN